MTNLQDAYEFGIDLNECSTKSSNGRVIKANFGNVKQFEPSCDLRFDR